MGKPSLERHFHQLNQRPTDDQPTISSKDQENGADTGSVHTLASVW